MILKFFRKFIKELRLRKKYYTHCYIVLPGEHHIPVLGISGLSLKLVTYQIYKKHKGVKYKIWVTDPNNEIPTEVCRDLSKKSRIAIISLIIGNKNESI